jgi:hypothetical protein
MPLRLYDRFFNRKSFAIRVVREALVYVSVVVALLAIYFVYVAVVHGFAFAIGGSNAVWFVRTTSYYSVLGLFAAIVSVSLEALRSRLGRRS